MNEPRQFRRGTTGGFKGFKTYLKQIQKKVWKKDCPRQSPKSFKRKYIPRKDKLDLTFIKYEEGLNPCRILIFRNKVLASNNLLDTNEFKSLMDNPLEYVKYIPFIYGRFSKEQVYNAIKNANKVVKTYAAEVDNEAFQVER